ncbi:MAG: guanylate kinase [Sinobacteraceae bacterium]|nr:guanylate kinase [Nevskiaceae bacterium]
MTRKPTPKQAPDKPTFKLTSAEVVPVGALWIVSAPSGGGKTSLCRALVPRLQARGLKVDISLSCTTREPRAREHDGVDYHFVDEARFQAMVEAGEFVEHAGVFGRHYGTPRAPLETALASDSVLLLDIDWQGARQIWAQYPQARGVFVLPPSVAELERRLRVREKDAGKNAQALIAKRMRAARAEISHYAEYPFVIINETFETALAEFEMLVVADALRSEAQSRRYSGLLHQLLDEPAGFSVE